MFILFCLLIMPIALLSEEVFVLNKSSEWDGHPKMSQEGVFQVEKSRRLISMNSFAVSEDKEYTLSGEFRLVNTSKAAPFFFGFLPVAENGKRIEHQHFRLYKNATMGEVAFDVQAGATELLLSKAAYWPTQANGLYIALNAQEDQSDLPNFNIIPVKKCKTESGKTVVFLQTPLTQNVAKGDLVRLQCQGASFIYVAATAKILTSEWQTCSGKIKFGGKGHTWFPGTAKAHVVFFGGSADGIVEFRNVNISSETVGSAVIRYHEIDLAPRSNGTVISVSDSAKRDNFRAASMYDGKDDTAFLSSPAMTEHDIDIHWFIQTVDLNGVAIDFTPLDYDYQESFGYLSHQADTIIKHFNGKSVLPETVKISVKQYNQWIDIGEIPVTTEHFLYRFPATMQDIHRVCIKFTTKLGDSVAVREIQLPGRKQPDAMDFIPAMSNNGGHFIWHSQTDCFPQTKEATYYFRSKFSLKDAQIEKAYLSVAAYNKASFVVNGQKIIDKVETPPGGLPRLVRCEIPLDWLKKDNLLAFQATKYDLLQGIYGVIFQVAVRYADGGIEYIGSNSENTQSSEVAEPGWDTELNGFENWTAAHGRFSADSFPGHTWSMDYSVPFFDDEVELLAYRLTPPIPRSGEKYTLEFDFNIQKPLKNNYAITCRFGEFPVEFYANFVLGANMTSPYDGMFSGDVGNKTYVIDGVWCEEVSPALPIRLAVSDGQSQAFIHSKLGVMTESPFAGQLSLLLGQEEYELHHGFPKAEIRKQNLYIDGKVAAPFFLADNKLAAGRIADQLDNNALDMVRAGSWHPVVADTHTRRIVQDSYIATIRQTANYSLRKNPNTKLMLVFELNPAQDWLFENPDEQIVLGDNSRLMGFYNNRGKGTISVRGSMASQAYRKLVYDSLFELVKRIEKEPFANAVVAVAFAVGLAGENNYGVDRYDFTRGDRTRDNCLVGDFGVASRKALVDFLLKRYKNNQAWASAWKVAEKNAEISDLNSFEKWPNEKIQHVMLWKDRPQDRFIFRDSKAFGHMAEDLNEFSSLQRAEFLLNAGKAVKEASNNCLITGTYMGYIWPQLVNNPVGSSVYSGHAAARMVRQSPYIDFFSSPQWVHTVDLPVFYSVLVDSLKLFGKTFIVEADIRTHYAAFGALYDRQEMISQMRKICGFMLTKKCGAYFYGWSYSFSGSQGVRFFSDPALLEELKCLREQSMLPNLRDVAPGTRIALIVSEQSAWYMDLLSPANTVHGIFLYKNLYKFLRAGTGCDIYALEDLPELVRTGCIDDYKFVVFPNAYHLNDELRHLINTKVKANNRTVMFFFAPGYHDDDFNTGNSSMSTEAIADIIGTQNVMAIHEERRLGADWQNVGETLECSLWWDKYQKALFTDEIGPIFYLTPDKDMEVLATLRIDGKSHYDKVSAFRMKKKDHTVIYSSLPTIPHRMLTQLVLDSGTQVVTTSDHTIVNVGNGFLAVTNIGEPREIELCLQTNCDWFELPKNSKVAENQKKIQMFIGQGETKLFRTTGK